MPIFVLISRHSPENCSMFNAKARKATLEYMDKSEKLMKKHGIKSLGGWNIHTEHLTIGVFEAPSFDAFEKLGMEPEVLALSEFETYEVKAAVSMEEVPKMLKQMR
jgi:hypothetical protein